MNYYFFFEESNLFDKWIEANNVQDIEYEEVVISADTGVGKDSSAEVIIRKSNGQFIIESIKTNNNDQRTNLADSLPANPDRSCKELIKYTG